MEEDLEKEVYKLEKYLRRHRSDDFVDELKRLSLDQLKDRIKTQALYRQETITARNKDLELQNAKAVSRDLAAPYSESLRMNDKVSRLISLLINEKG